MTLKKHSDRCMAVTGHKLCMPEAVKTNASKLALGCFHREAFSHLFCLAFRKLRPSIPTASPHWPVLSSDGQLSATVSQSSQTPSSVCPCTSASAPWLPLLPLPRTPRVHFGLTKHKECFEEALSPVFSPTAQTLCAPGVLVLCIC